jgi:epoxyqueuosine reductase QueG
MREGPPAQRPIPGVPPDRDRGASRAETVTISSFFGKPVRVRLHYVVDGCGICENVCPLEGKAEIEVFGAKDRTQTS